MTDKELDILFAESAQQQKAVEQINRQVMKTVRKDMRRKSVIKWGKLLALCFGLPLLVVLFAYALFTYLPDMQLPLRIVTFALPLGTIILWTGKELHDFSLSDM